MKKIKYIEDLYDKYDIQMGISIGAFYTLVQEINKKRRSRPK